MAYSRALHLLRQVLAQIPGLPVYARLFLVTLTLSLALAALLVTATSGGWGAHVMSIPTFVASISDHIFHFDPSTPCSMPSPCP